MSTEDHTIPGPSVKGQPDENLTTESVTLDSFQNLDQLTESSIDTTQITKIENLEDDEDKENISFDEDILNLSNFTISDMNLSDRELYNILEGNMEGELADNSVIENVLSDLLTNIEKDGQTDDHPAKEGSRAQELPEHNDTNTLSPLQIKDDNIDKCAAHTKKIDFSKMKPDVVNDTLYTIQEESLETEFDDKLTLDWPNNLKKVTRRKISKGGICTYESVWEMDSDEELKVLMTAQQVKRKKTENVRNWGISIEKMDRSKCNPDGSDSTTQDAIPGTSWQIEFDHSTIKDISNAFQNLENLPRSNFIMSEESDLESETDDVPNKSSRPRKKRAI